MTFLNTLAAFAVAVTCATAGAAADYPDPVEGDFVLPSFTFHDGTTLTDVKLHYYTIGDPANAPVVLLHGTAASGRQMMGEGFAGQMFGPGQPLDAGKYFLVFPDAIGTGGSTRPSDGMKARFPQYNYDDMVDLQHAVLTQGLGLDHVRLVMGYSMGGMNVWTWATRYPDYADAWIPMAALPSPMAGRNWMLRKMMIESVRQDPAWMNGDYTEQPPNLRIATIWFGLATFGGDQALWAKAPTNEAASAMVMDRLANATVGDANDVMYQWDASRDFDPTPDLGRIAAPLLVINSDDDERNPLDLGILEAAMPKVAQGEVLILEGSDTTSGHGTPMQAALYADKVADFLSRAPKK
jgi:homoserine O-acetyltransferase